MCCCPPESFWYSHPLFEATKAEQCWKTIPRFFNPKYLRSLLEIGCRPNVAARTRFVRISTLEMARFSSWMSHIVVVGRFQRCFRNWNNSVAHSKYLHIGWHMGDFVALLQTEVYPTKGLSWKPLLHHSSTEWSNTLRNHVGFRVMASPVCQCLFGNDFLDDPHLQHASRQSLTFHFWNVVAEDVTSTCSPEKFLMVSDITLVIATAFHFWSAVLYLQMSDLIQD